MRILRVTVKVTCLCQAASKELEFTSCTCVAQPSQSVVGSSSQPQEPDSKQEVCCSDTTHELAARKMCIKRFRIGVGGDSVFCWNASINRVKRIERESKGRKEKCIKMLWANYETYACQIWGPENPKPCREEPCSRLLASPQAHCRATVGSAMPPPAVTSLEPSLSFSAHPPRLQPPV